jgi:hypothetical protein
MSERRRVSRRRADADMDNSVEAVLARLATQGYPSDLETARKVQLASMRGMLYWTTRRLTTSDESQLDLRPIARGSTRPRR